MSDSNPSSQPLKVIDAEVQVMPGSALEAITRGEIDVQIATAHKFPRSIEVFKKRATEMACIDEDTAASCLYARPVGKDPDTGRQKTAEGMSIRMAEIVGACYGNLRVGAMIVEQTPRYVKVRGFAHDLETNVASSTEVIEATVKRPRQGQTEGDPYDERMRIVIAKAALAKARRDATFQVVPRALAKPIEKAVRALLAGDAKSIERRREIAMKWLEQNKVAPERMFAALGINGVADLSLNHLDTLTGLRTAIIDGETSFEEAFPPIIKTGSVGAPAGENKPAPAASTPSEEAANAKSQPDPKEKAAPKGPSAVELRKSILAEATKVGAGKVRVCEVAAELKLVPEGVKWDDLDRDQLIAMSDAVEQIIDKIKPPSA